MQTKKWRIKAAVLCLCVGVVSAVAFGDELALGGLLPEYEIIDLGSLGGGNTTPRAVNEAGQVAGWSYTPYTPDGFFNHAFLWDPVDVDGMIDLGTLSGREYSNALALNDYGVVVGSSGGSDELWPVIWDSVNGMRYLDGLEEGCEGGALGINNAGQVVGIGGDGEACGGFLWSGGSVTYFDRGVGTAINNAGQVAGNTADGAFIWDSENGMRDLGTLPGYESRASAISDAGQVVGWLDNTSGPWDPHAFLWEAGSGMIDLGPGRAWGVNDSGQVVGSMNNLDLAFYWSADTGMIRLDELLVSDSGWLRLCDALDINNRGQIVGIGITDHGRRRAFLMTPVRPKIIYVDANAAGANDGTSWENAYKYLQDALMFAAAGDEIRVAQGVYRPDQSAYLDGIIEGDRRVSFQLKSGVSLRGGYAGFGSPDPNRRGVENFETILSGDLAGNDAPGFINRQENSYHVVLGELRQPYPLEDTLLDGFTVTGGNADGQSGYDGRGGGILINIDCALTVRNCTITGNRAEYSGGGMHSIGSGGCDSAIEDCRFVGNIAGVEGGGISLDGESIPYMTNCLFAGNLAGTGGALYDADSYPRIINCTFTGNRALSECGGVRECGGGVQLRSCILWGNSDSSGSGEPAQLRSRIDYWPNTNYCCIQGWTGALGGVGNHGDDPCFASHGWWDQNGTPDDPNDDLWADGDYHLKSQAGRWDTTEGRWVMDEVTSPCIDAGDPASPVGYEPFPNGGVINMGAYGGTAEASKSYFGRPPCETIVTGDINGDCRINFLDFRLMALHWMDEH